MATHQTDIKELALKKGVLPHITCVLAKKLFLKGNSTGGDMNMY